MSSLMPDISCFSSFFSKSVGSDLSLVLHFYQIIINFRNIDLIKKKEKLDLIYRMKSKVTNSRIKLQK